jgi:hydrogenase maturation protein HypF
VFANRRLLDGVSRGLTAAGVNVLVPKKLPVNDGGISYGQAAIAATRMSA